MRDAGVAHILGFVDDDPRLVSRDVNGIRVHDPRNLKSLIENLGIEEIVLSVPSATTDEKPRLPVCFPRIGSCYSPNSLAHEMDV